ncbi:MAG: VOC family protein [Gammaproteobacteria bacterium]|nr:VOC family protein [Gammaproteobacteria bacterium]
MIWASKPSMTARTKHSTTTRHCRRPMGFESSSSSMWMVVDMLPPWLPGDPGRHTYRSWSHVANGGGPGDVRASGPLIGLEPTVTDVSLTPYLSPHDCAAAIAFYEKAFGAVETGARFTDPEGRIGHSEITIGGATIYLSDEFPDFGACSPQSLGGSSAALHIRVADADETARRLVAAGAEVLHEVAEQADGERRGTFLDPFGYRWMVGEKLEEVSKEELRSRVSGFDVT